MSKVSELTAPTNGKFLGTHKTKMFNLYVPEMAAEYDQLRTDANDKSKGITIENLRQLTRKTKVSEGESFTETEDLFMLVEWWEKNPAKPNLNS